MRKGSIILFLLLVAITVTTHAAPENLKLHGAALHKVAGLFKVLNGFLYLENPEHAQNILADVPKKLEFEYLRDIKANLLVENSLETLCENLSPEELAKIQVRVGHVNALFGDVKKIGRASCRERV